MNNESKLHDAVPLIAHELDRQDPANREHQTILEFLRRLSIGRIIAIVGSGTSSIYGYRTWEQFINGLCAMLIDMAEKEQQNLRQQYSPHQGSTSLHEGKQHSKQHGGDQGNDEKTGETSKPYESRMSPSGVDLSLNILATSSKSRLSSEKLDLQEKLSVCGAIINCLTDKGKEEYWKSLAKWFGPQTTFKWSDFGSDNSAQSLRTKLENMLCQKKTTSAPKADSFLPPDLSHLLSILPTKAPVLRKLSDDELEKGYYPITPDQKISAHRNACDPLAKLRSTLNIHRYATFNYDLEIESLLEDLDYPFNSLTHLRNEDADRISQSRVGGIARSISLSANNAAELIALAAIPSSANDMIVHMHGAITRPKKMIVTQSDYNDLYVERYTSRQAFEDARNLLFSGNAVIHVGFGLSEDDLMRPLRYLNSSRRNRPLFALMPMLTSEAKSKALAHKVKSTYGVNVVTYGLSMGSIRNLKFVEGSPDHPLQRFAGEFISLGEELKNIDSAFEHVDCISSLCIRENAPRLHYSKIAIPTIEHLISLGSDGIDFSKRGGFVGFLRAIAISTALNNALEYFQASVVEWQKGFNIGRPRTKDGVSVDYGCVARHGTHYYPTQDQESGSNSDQALFEADKSQAHNAFQTILQKPACSRVSIFKFESGKGKGTFVSHLRDEAKEKYGKDGKVARFIALDYTMRAKSVMTDVLDHIGNTQFLCLNNADQLLDLKSGTPKNVFILLFLREIRKASLESGTLRVALIVRAETAKRAYSEFFRISSHQHVAENSEIHPQKIHDKPFTIFSNLCATSDVLQRILEGNRWANILLANVCTQLENWKVCDTKHFVKKCCDVLASKMFGIDRAYEQAVFCGIVLEERQRSTQRLSHADGRKIIVVENIILKWMFSIFIAVDRDTIARIPEITSLKHDLGYTITDENVEQAINSLLECGLIYRLDLAPDRSERYVLHGAVRQYLSHKRGLSFDEHSGRDSQSITLAPVLTDRGPNLNAEDYRSTCDLVDHFLAGESANNVDGVPAASQIGKYKRYGSDHRIILRSAYAILKDVLNVQNSMRAGLAYTSDHATSSLLSVHLGRLGRLRSAALAVDGATNKIEEKSAGESSATQSPMSAPVIYWHDRVWLLNEMGIVRFLQGNFHDAMLIFRQTMQSVEHDDTQDPLLKPRLLINLALCLIERARFVDAIREIDQSISVLEEMQGLEFNPHFEQTTENQKDSRHSFSLSQNQEFKLLYAIALGTKAQIQLLSAELRPAKTSIKQALQLISDTGAIGARGWLHHVRAQIALAGGDFDSAKRHSVLALAAARGSQRPDLILSFEVAEIEFDLRNAGFSREAVLTALSRLEDLEVMVQRLGSYKLQVGILLLRTRALLTMEQVESARTSALEAISLAQLNGMRLRRISGLIMLVALMAMRGEKEPAKKLLKSVKLAATRARYVRAVVEIEGLEQSIDVEGGIPGWAGYVSEFSRSSQSHLPRK